MQLVWEGAHLMKRVLQSIAPITNLIELGIWSFLTLRMHPLAPHWKRAIVRMNELRNPL